MRFPTNATLQELAERIVEVYDLTLFKGAVVPAAILFVDDTETQASAIKRAAREAKVFDIKEIPPAVAERTGYDYLVTFFKLNASDLSGEMIAAHLTEQLLRIDPEGGLRQPDVKTFIPLAKVMGPDWKQQQFAKVDVLSGALSKGIPQQVRLDVSEVMDKAAAAINAGALDRDGTKVTATVHRPS